MTSNDIITAIMRGDFDDDLSNINQAIVSRMKIARDIKASTLKATLKVGTTVRIEAIKPKYLEGIVGEVTRIDGGRGGGYATIKPTKPVFIRSRLQEQIDGIPLSCLTVLEA